MTMAHPVRKKRRDMIPRITRLRLKRHLLIYEMVSDGDNETKSFLLMILCYLLCP